MKCHYVYDEKIRKAFIPYCWGAVIHGPRFCSCERSVPMTFEQFEKKEFNKKIKELTLENRELEKENARLNRLIKKLIHQLQNERRNITRSSLG
jgi:hypothetical protein